MTAQDSFGNVVPGYAGIVQFSSNDSYATLPANATLQSGAGFFSATLRTAGSDAVTATDSSATGIVGSSTVSIAPIGTTQFAVTAPAVATQFGNFLFTVSARDNFNNIASSYKGTVTFGSTDGFASLPLPTTLANGVGVFSAVLRTQGNQTLTATDAGNALSGVSSIIAVVGSPATHFLITAPATAQAGTAFAATITALDQFNTPVNSYAGTIHFASSDPLSVLPADATLSSGTGIFAFFLGTAGNQIITATDTVTATIIGVSIPINVSPLNASHFAVSIAPGNDIAGSSSIVTVTAEDLFNNVVTTFLGPVHFSSTDPTATLPPNSAITGGSGQFAVTWRTAGFQTVTAADSLDNIGGVSNLVSISPASATHFVVAGPNSVSAGTALWSA